MELTKLIKNLNQYAIVGDLDPVIHDLYYDSRKVVPNSLFFCIKGANTDGHRFAYDAINRGAVALVTERKLDVPDHITQIIVNDSKDAMAVISSDFFGNPADKLTLIGVTGTNGKTTVTYLIKAIAEQHGKKVGVIGTIMNLIGDKKMPTERTTPESLDLNRLSHEMVRERVEWVAMEVSSHSLELGRVKGIPFEVGIFTNLSQDHLDFHKTMENYQKSKEKLFHQSRIGIINMDDPKGRIIAESLRIPVYGYGLQWETDAGVRDIVVSAKGTSFRASFHEKEIDFHLNIPGIFSVYNGMAAATACHVLGIPLETIKKGLESVKSVPGRFEVLDTKGKEYTVLLDYAHTPDGLENVLKTVAEFAKGEIITLFGCGGDRDPGKRPIMGEVAGRYSDFCIITSDNPRNEDPFSIIKQIEVGVKITGCPYVTIENRKEAIEYALKHGKKGDVIILAGKGHETYQEIKGKRYDFDEKQIVMEILASGD
ncbi:MAG: UDP-N-acetylmuramoyl-L-alanyl-D-glutamate--2,6-diaminopimelate ligase [Clostridia bacterium]|jgi:UDP-N-acetylmuramoyl-L-alanyl-D-glutamate--2,6-diaminopimelate ligase